MKQLLVYLFAICIPALWAQETEQAPEEERLKTRAEIIEAELNLPDIDDNFTILTYKHVSVLARDYPSAQVVANIAKEAVELLKVHFSFPNEFNVPIFFQLISPEDRQMAAPYTIEVARGVEVLVSIRWEENTDLAEVCEATVRGILKKWIINNLGVEFTSKTPVWLEMALGRRLQERMRPAIRESYIHRARKMPFITLEDLVDKAPTQKHQLEPLRDHAYWLYYFMLKEFPQRHEYSHFLLQLMKGETFIEQLNEQYNDTLRNENRRTLWWAVAFRESMSVRDDTLETRTRSRNRLTDYSLLRIEIDGGDYDISLDQLWIMRKHPNLLSALRWRLRDIKVALTEVNPLYYNAFHSLGLIFESLQYDDIEYTTRMMNMHKEDLVQLEKIEKILNKYFSEK